MSKTSVFVSGSVILYLCFMALISSGCRSEDSTERDRWPSKYSVAGSAEIDKDTRTNAESYSIAAASMTKAFSEAADESYKGMAGLSNDYTKDINSVEKFSQDAMDSYTDSISKALDKYASAILYGYDAAYFLTNGIIGKRASSFFIKRDLSPTINLPDNNPGNGSVSSDFINDFGYLGFLAFRDFDILIRAMEERIKNGAYIINNSVEGSDEYKKINEELGIASDSSKSEALAAYDELQVKGKLTKIKKLEAINREYSDGSALTQSRDTIVQSCNEMVNSFKTSAPGTLYDSKDVDSDKAKLGFLMKAVGQDSEDLSLSYMGISANGISASTGTIATMVACIVSDKTPSSFHISKPLSDITDEDAKTLLSNMAASTYTGIKDAGSIRNALYAYALKEANELYVDGIKSTEADGSVWINIPEKNCARFLNKPGNNKSFMTPDFGVTESLVLMGGYLPEIYFNLDLIPTGFSIGAEYINVNKLTQRLVDIPSEKNMAIVTLIHPANIDTKPEQNRNFMVFANPLVPGIDISYKAVGGDSWEQTGVPMTNDSGYVEFFMPASPTDIEDTLNIKSGKEIEKNFKFKL